MILRDMKLYLGGFLIFLFGLTAQGSSLTIQVIKSSGVKAYDEAYSGFQKVINGNLKDVQFEEHILSSDIAENEKLIEQIKGNSALILTIGSEVTKFVSKRIKDHPVIFCMVLDPVESGLVESLAPSGNNLTGSSLDIPVRMQFERFKLLVPNLKILGVLYTSETEGKVRRAEVVANGLGINLVSVRISSEKEIPQSLELLKGQIQGLWSVPDGVIFSPSSTEQILLYTLRNGIPFMGLSSVYVKAGALFALDCDYVDIGKQAGEVALLILCGNLPSEVPITVPRKIYLTLNQKTAERIDLRVSKNILNVAEEVIR